jgi:AraC-type DNA-binding domain-containing proteins
MPASSQALHLNARAEALTPSLGRRTVVPARQPYRDFAHLLVLDAGALSALAGPEPAQAGEPLVAPAAIFLPHGEEAVFHLAPGSAGILIGAAPQLLTEAIGARAESVQLRILAERPMATGIADAVAHAGLVTFARGFAGELQDEARGSWMALAAHLRLILIALKRLSERAGAHPRLSEAEEVSLLQRFRQLVEARFRDHWPVARYAAELGVTTDRLHAVATRALSRAPVQLIQDRMVHEACLRLELSAGTAQEIAYGLGYAEPTYFSHFFKRRTGLTPAGYRRLVRERARLREPGPTFGFADWP